MPVARLCRVSRPVHGKQNGGAVAFARTGDPELGEFKDAEVIEKFGDVPDDLSEL